MPRHSKRTSRTNIRRLTGVRRIDAEPEDIAKAILDMALQDQEVSTPGRKSGKGKGTETTDKEYEKEDEDEEDND